MQWLAKTKKIPADQLKGKWEAYSIRRATSPWSNVGSILAITGSDQRGTAYGVFEVSKMIGVSPWYWWADVPVKQQNPLWLPLHKNIFSQPAVKYRGFFINDEAPALTGWVRKKYGGLNHLFYEKVFELLLRLKANYLWPAMWGNAFNDDDPLNPVEAAKYGIVMGTFPSRAHASGTAGMETLWLRPMGLSHERKCARQLLGERYRTHGHPRKHRDHRHARRRRQTHGRRQ